MYCKTYVNVSLVKMKNVKCSSVQYCKLIRPFTYYAARLSSSFISFLLIVDLNLSACFEVHFTFFPLDFISKMSLIVALSLLSPVTASMVKSSLEGKVSPLSKQIVKHHACQSCYFHLKMVTFTFPEKKSPPSLELSIRPLNDHSGTTQSIIKVPLLFC